MSKRFTRGLVAVAAIIVAVGATVILINVNSRTPAVTAIFKDATGVQLGYAVRSKGVEVGKVSSVGVVDGKAQFGLDVDKAVLPLHTDAKATIRPYNLLGERYIELDPGTPTAPVMSPPVIDETHTSSSVDIQDILNTLNDPTSTALAATVTGLGEGMRGAGPDTAAALKALQPAMQRTGELSQILDQQNDTLNQLVDRTQPVTNALAGDQGQQLDHLLGTTQQTLDTVASNRSQLDQSLTELPSTVAAARTTLSRLAGTADAATPTLAAIRPVTDNLNDITGELKTLADSADPALASLPPVLDKGKTLLDEAEPVVSQLRQAGPDLRGSASGAKPLAQQLLDKNQALPDLMDFIRMWSLTTNDSDGLSHYFRGNAHIGPAALRQMIAGSPVGGAIPGGAQLPPSIPLPGDPPQQANSQAQGVPPPGTAPASANQGATGLTSQQENSMVGQLLGGH